MNMPTRPPYQGVFEKLEFQPYKFAEYPKTVKDANGKRVTVKTQREELAIVAEAAASAPHDPVVEQKNLLLDENARLKAQIAAMQKGSLQPEAVQTTIGGETKADEAAKAQVL